MIHAIASPIQSPFAPRPKAASAQASPSAPLDTVAPPSLPAEPPAAAAAPPAPSAAPVWKAVAVTALLAAPIIAGALTLAPAQEVPAPPPVSSCLVEASTQIAEPPVPARTFRRIAEMAQPTVLDNPTAQNVRTAYGRTADAAREHAATFARDAARLQQQGATLESLSSREAGAFSEGECRVSVDKTETATVVSTEGADGKASMQIRDGLRMVTLETPEGTITLQESATQRQVLTPTVSRTLYLQDVSSHKAGDFEVVVRDGRPGIVDGGTRRMEHLVVRGTTVTDEVRETISGYAGNIDIHRVETFEIPQQVAQIFPQVKLRETSRVDHHDALTGQHTSIQRQLEVRQDGSTKIRETIDGQQRESVEPPAVIVRGG